MTWQWDSGQSFRLPGNSSDTSDRIWTFLFLSLLSTSCHYDSLLTLSVFLLFNSLSLTAVKCHFHHFLHFLQFFCHFLYSCISMFYTLITSLTYSIRLCFRDAPTFSAISILSSRPVVFVFGHRMLDSSLYFSLVSLPGEKIQVLFFLFCSGLFHCSFPVCSPLMLFMLNMRESLRDR